MRKRGEKPESCAGLLWSGKNPEEACLNENCTHGPKKQRAARMKSDKAWALYCCKLCGDAVRRRKYYLGQKDKKK